MLLLPPPAPPSPPAPQGYVLYSQRRKLKAELQGKSQEEIRQLRLKGEDVTDTITVRHWLIVQKPALIKSTV